jgi:acyl-CoA reductase-like NAD-dependent aldehyde dehydrogenase
MRWGRKTLKGYWRHPTVGLPAIVPEQPVAEAATAERETLAPELEAVTRLALEKMTQILKIPTDRGDGNLLRAQTAAAAIAINTQMRADEAKLKQARRGDMMERILAMMAEEKAKLAELMAEDEQAAARTEIVGPSAAEDAPDADDCA